MKYFLTIIIITHIVSGPQYLYAQSAQRTISGVVTSFEESLPLEGVKVSIKGSAKNSGTQADGVYYITVNTEDSILIFNLPGYETKEIKITKSSEYNVTLRSGGAQQLSLNKEEMIQSFRCRR